MGDLARGTRLCFGTSVGHPLVERAGLSLATIRQDGVLTVLPCTDRNFGSRWHAQSQADVPA